MLLCPLLNSMLFVLVDCMKLPRFDDANVVIVGDAMLDRYWHGEADRISAEAPIPVVNISEIEDRPGGAANVALNIVALGAKASLIAAVGKDEESRILRSKLETAGIGCLFYEDAEYRTTTKLRIISQNQQLVRADFEQIREIDQAAILKLVKSAIQQTQVLILSDYDKGVIVNPQETIAFARKNGTAVLVDPKFKDFGIYRGASVLKPNRHELQKAVGAWSTEEEMVLKCKKLITDLELGAVLVTRDVEGMTLIEGGDKPETHFPAHTREVYDQSGAGDTVISVLGASLASDVPLTDAVGLANIGAGIAVSYLGTVSVSGPELRLEVATDYGFDKGVMSNDQLKIVVEAAKAKGERVVFTNGCFDLLHAGHVDYLEEARQQGDRLIVAVNDDDSVNRLKGAGRPINPVERRMIMLAGLTAVDWVVAFSGDTPEALLEEMKPDILIKGGDYSVGQVVGADIVKSYGGEVRVVSLVEDCSTSALVEKIRQS